MLFCLGVSAAQAYDKTMGFGVPGRPEDLVKNPSLVFGFMSLAATPSLNPKPCNPKTLNLNFANPKPRNLNPQTLQTLYPKPWKPCYREARAAPMNFSKSMSWRSRHFLVRRNMGALIITTGFGNWGYIILHQD